LRREKGPPGLADLLALAGVVGLSGCSMPAALAPVTPRGGAVSNLIWSFSLLCAFIWLLVMAALARARAGQGVFRRAGCALCHTIAGTPAGGAVGLYVIGFIVVFGIGGLTGVMLASVPLDSQVHDTYFVVAHFHYVLIGGAVFPLLAAVYYWFPKFTGRMMSERLGQWQFAILFIGFNLTFFPMHILGLEGMARRMYTFRLGRPQPHRDDWRAAAVRQFCSLRLERGRELPARAAGAGQSLGGAVHGDHPVARHRRPVFQRVRVMDAAFNRLIAGAGCFSGARITGWTLDPMVLVPFLAGGLVYALGVSNLWRSAGLGRGASGMQVACFAGGWLLMGVALVGRVPSRSTSHPIILRCSIRLAAIG
jgi:hypothetical protein